MDFKSVVGQQVAKAGVLQMWSHNTLPHALMITGAEGTGGLPFALALAQYIFCENRNETDSCGKCAGCSKVSRLEHADLHLSFPTISHKSGVKPMSRNHMQEFREFVRQAPYGTTYDWLQYINAENKQGNITAEECREIIEQLYLKPYEGNRKVLIMWRPEYLGREGNILLKIIEEPPHNTVIIFVAENKEDILATILSRTQEIKLSPISAGDIAEALSTRALTDPTKAAQVAQIAMGSYTEALRLLQHAENDLLQSVRDMFNVVFRANAPGISKFADEWSKAGREQQKNLLHFVIQLMEHTVKARYMPDAAIHLPPAETDFVRRLAGSKLSLDGLNQFVKILSDTIYYIERNAHGKTQLHAMLIRMQYVTQGREIPV